MDAHRWVARAVAWGRVGGGANDRLLYLYNDGVIKTRLEKGAHTINESLHKGSNKISIST